MSTEEEDGSTSKWVQPAWWAPPEGWIGGGVPHEAILGQSGSAAVIIRYLSVYPTGLGFQLLAFTRPQARESLSRADDARGSSDVKSQLRVRVSGGVDTEGSPEDLHQLTDGLRFGVEFEDGRRAERHDPVGGPGDFTIKGFQNGEPCSPDPDLNIVMAGGSGESSPRQLCEERFVWPLAPKGPLAFFAEWPAVGIPEHRIELQESMLQEALRRARMIWPPST